MSSVALWQYPLRIFILYVLVMLALRFMGKREIGQLSIFDLVVSIMIAELSTLPMEDTDVPIYQAMIAIGTLVCFQIIVAFIQIKSHRFRHWVDGEPTVLIERGQIHDNVMKKSRYSMQDLLTQLREKGVSNVADVEFAILETTGKLSVFPTAAARPVTARDMDQSVNDDSMPMPIIIDGTPVKKTLEMTGRDEPWLEQEIHHRGYGSVQDVFYASMDGQGQIWIDERDVKKRTDAKSKDGQN